MRPPPTVMMFLFRISAKGVSFAALVVAAASCSSARQVTDVDGNFYPVVTIGAQTWLAANLRATRSPDGQPLVVHAPNDDPAAVAGFGLLYDWTNARRACMQGWHLPSDQEWSVLTAHVGALAGGALKDTTGWPGLNAGATNRLGFAARPAGYWNDAGFDNLFGQTVVYWSSTPQDTHFVWTRSLAAAHDSLRRVAQHPTYGLAVRCVCDSR